jgi:hypothetical protein
MRKVKQGTLTDQAHAPFLYFDGTSNCGYGNGIINVTIVANRFLPTTAGEILPEAVAIAHLRCSVAAAEDLKAALEKALLVAAPATGRTN